MANYFKSRTKKRAQKVHKKNRPFCALCALCFYKFGDYPKGTSPFNSNIWIKKAKDERGLKIVHDCDDKEYLIGYIKEKGDNICFTNPENKEFTLPRHNGF